MTRSKKTQKINHNNVVNSAFIENLDDYLLTQILFRLPSCASVLACKPVNKHWYSLISDPRFAALFSDHKTRKAALLKSCPTTHDEEPPWTYLISMDDFTQRFQPKFDCVGNACTNQAVFRSTKFNLEYLPCRFYVKATFRDLVLCSDVETCREGRGQIYYITNPLTKQWVALPPSPGFENDWGLKQWAAFMCRQPHDYTQDYQFRVVLIMGQKQLPVYQLLVYCSEIDKWKKINLHVQIKPKLAAQKSLYNSAFQVVVCDGVIFLYHKLGFAAFNPFDVDETTNNSTVIEAKLLPSLHVKGFLLESSGNLYFIYTPKIETGPVCYKKNGSAIEMALKVWKLNPNQVPLKWEATFDGTCSGNLNKVVQASLSNDINFSSNVLHLGMHPRDDKLIYMHLCIEEQFILCDTRSRLIMPSKSLPHCSLNTIHRFEIQWWPTSIPKARSSATLFSKYSYDVPCFFV